MATNGISNYLENKLVDHATGHASFTAPANIYLALLTVAPSNSTTQGTWTEAVFTNYVRVAIPTSSLNAAAGTTPPQVTNSVAITFPACGVTPSTLLGFAIVDNLSGTGGNILWYGAISSTVVSSGIIYSVAIGNLALSLPEASGLGDFAAKKLLDHWSGKSSWSVPTLYMGLCTASATSSYTEVSYTGYSGAVRANATTQIAASSGNAPASATNSVGTIVHAACTGGSATATNYILTDTNTVGAGSNIVWYGTVTSQAIASGQTPTTATSALTLQIT